MHILNLYVSYNYRFSFLDFDEDAAEEPVESPDTGKLESTPKSNLLGVSPAPHHPSPLLRANASNSSARARTRTSSASSSSSDEGDNIS